MMLKFDGELMMSVLQSITIALGFISYITQISPHTEPTFSVHRSYIFFHAVCVINQAEIVQVH